MAGVKRRSDAEIPHAKRPKVTNFDSDNELEEENVASHVSEGSKEEEEEIAVDQDTNEIETSGITWADFTGYGAKEIFNFYQYEKLEQFYEEQIALYPWMIQTREQREPIQLAHHLCCCKKKYAILKKKGRRETRKVSEEKLKEFCQEKSIPLSDPVEDAVIDYCIQQDDTWFEIISQLQE